MEIGERIKIIRGRTPRAEFAETLGIHPQTLYMYEKGKRVVDVELIQRICAKFNVPVEWLIFGEGGLRNADYGGGADPRLQTRLAEQEALLAEQDVKITQLTNELIAAQAGALKAYEMAMGALRNGTEPQPRAPTTARRKNVGQEPEEQKET